MGNSVYGHPVLRNILQNDLYQIPQVTSNHIRRGQICGVNTVRERKTCLSLLENKRYWVSQNVSYGYGHPETYKHGYKDSHIVAGNGCRIKLLDEYQNGDFLAEDFDGEDFLVESNELENLTILEAGKKGDVEEDYFCGELKTTLLINGDTYKYDIDEVNENYTYYNLK